MGEKYHISDGKKETGPYTIEQLKEIPLNDSFLVWKQGLNKWLKITEVPELSILVYSVPPPISKQKNTKILYYKIKHAIVTAVIVFIVFSLENEILSLIPLHYGEATHWAGFIVWTAFILTIIFSIRIYRKNIRALK
tara:strand:+ start:358 stop:768 length:411 start_codon:yes stop_codon:yes gene_type:complete